MARKKKESSGGGDEWLTTYSDLVTLLFAFFVLLYAFSVVDEAKFTAFAESLNAVLNGKYDLLDQIVIPEFTENKNLAEEDTGILDKDGEEILEINRDEEVDKLEEARKLQLIQDLTQYILDNNLEDFVEVRATQDYVTISIKDIVVFDPADASLKPESEYFLLEVSNFLNGIDNFIAIEGHTDNVPINTEKYPSNWELSLYRALSVGKFLMDEGGVSEERVELSGHGEYKPIDTNDTYEGRSRNRRVDIVLLY